MNWISYFFFIFSFFCSLSVNGANNFGYILSYSSYNLGDDIQSIAAKNFLPKNSIAIDRERIGHFDHSSVVKTILSGWIMRITALPKKIWPPSLSIDPLLISIHFADEFISHALSNKSIEYYKKHGPVGARDYYTLKNLQKKNIPSYFSGCLTLTLENSCKTRNDIIYAVDISDACVNFIKSKTKSKVVILTHLVSANMSRDPEQRLKYAEEILEKYKRAKCVVTSRLHATMPCLAFQTPVLLIPATETDHFDHRFDGLKELTRYCSRGELLTGLVNFNFDNPTENPTLYIPIKEKLIHTITEWVSSHSNII